MKDYQDILFPYAYNILGSAEDARDAIQDVLYNYVTVKKEEIDNEKNYLIRSVINQSINIRNKRKKISYGDVWLPEPVATEGADTNINLKDIVSYSLLVLLEQLNPKERAVFILKEAFNYSHEEIAEVLSGTVEHSRKLLSRAKIKLNPGQQPPKVSKKEVRNPGILEKYVSAIRGRDTVALESVLSQDIAFFADGGDKINVVKKMATGQNEVAALLAFIFDKFQTALTIVPAEINYQPALLYYRDDKLVTCQVFGISADGNKIVQINTVLDPEKLKNILEH
jgi:RNA polymerase sigma factor (sigma-70 family)